MSVREVSPDANVMTHVAGPLIRYESRQRQRCSWCGFVLVDDDLERIAVPIPPCEFCGVLYRQESVGQPCTGRVRAAHSFPAPSPPGGFPFEQFVRVMVDGGFRTSSVVDVPADPDGSVRVPEDACMRLPAELTGVKDA